MSFRKPLKYVLVLFIAAAIALAVLWKTGTLARWGQWAEKKAIAALIRKLQPKLPFKIESVDLDAGWPKSRLKIALRWGDWRARLDGPFWLNKRDNPDDFNVHYEPRVQADPFPQPIDLALEVETANFFKDILGAKLETQAGKWDWPLIGIQSEGLRVSAAVSANLINADISLKSLTWTRDKEHLIQISQPAVTIRKTAQAVIAAQGAEILWGELYLDLPLDKLPLQITTDGNLPPARASIQLPAIHADIKDRHVNWSAGPLPLPEIFARFATALKLPPELLRAGTLTANGTEAGGKLALKDLALSWPERAIAATGVNLSADFSVNSASGTLRAGRVYFKHFAGTLEETPFKLSLTKQISLPKGLGLKIDGLPLTIGPVSGSLDSLRTAVHLAETPIETIARGLCLKTRLPPATVSVRLPKIELQPDSIEPEGSAEIKLFDGRIEIDDLGAYNLDTQVPEFDFSARWNRIRLDQLDGFGHFGQMDGLITGHAEDVTFQSWLPTQYDFFLELKPHHAKDVVFSPQAMRNFARLVAGAESIDGLPGVAQWAAFGWPRDVVGGYDVDCAGISVISVEGEILIESLPCQKALKDDKSPYILYDRWFKMPLRSNRLVIDAPALSNYIRGMAGRFEEMFNPEPKLVTKKENTHEDPCLPPDPGPARNR